MWNELDVDEVMMRLRCIDCSALLAAYDIDYDPTHDDAKKVLEQVAEHVKQSKCSGSIAIDCKSKHATMVAINQ